MRVVILTEAELELGVHTIELARLTGHAKPGPERATDAAGLERKLRAALEARAGAEPSIAELASALEVLERARLAHLPGVPLDLAEQLLALHSALEFYADHGSYQVDDGYPLDYPIMRDRGARARAALRQEARA